MTAPPADPARPAPRRAGGELTTRLLTAAVGIPLLFVAIVVGGPLYAAVAAVALGIGYLELTSAAGLGGTSLRGIGTAAVAGLALAAQGGDFARVVAVLAALSVASLVVLLREPPAPEVFARWSAALAGVLYIGLLGAHFVLLRDLPAGRDWVILAVLLTFASDAGAYAVGRRLGRRKLAPKLSPGKTVEGAVGGLVAGALAAAALVALLALDVPPLATVALGLAAAIAAQTGDLVESALKRSLSVKDMGRIVPGHGGLLDRLDSLLFVLPLVYWVARW